MFAVARSGSDCTLWEGEHWTPVGLSTGWGFALQTSLHQPACQHLQPTHTANYYSTYFVLIFLAVQTYFVSIFLSGANNCTWLYLIVPDCTWLHLIVSDCTWLYLIAEAQKPKTFRIASFYAQKFSGRSARIHFLRHIKKCVILSCDISKSA